MTWMVSMASTSAYHNTVPANSTPKTQRSSARLSFGHHSVVMFISVCTCSNTVLYVHLYSPSSILLTDLAFTFLFILRTCEPPAAAPTPHIHLFRSFSHLVSRIIISFHLPLLGVQRTLVSLLLVPCFKATGHLFRTSAFFWLTLQRT